MVRAWYMDNSTTDQRLEHHKDPPKYISLKDLYKITGVEYFRIEGLDSLKDNEVLNKLKKERNYTYEDELVCSKECLPNYEDKLKSFFQEHLHTDEEIRLVLDGSGYFDARDKNDEWIRIEVTPGDLLVLPKGIYHRFTLDTKNYIKAKRYFVGEPVWTPHNRPADDMPCRKEYIARMLEVFISHDDFTMFCYKYKSWRCCSFAEGMWLVLVTSIVACCGSSRINQHPVDYKQQIFNSTVDHSQAADEEGQHEEILLSNNTNVYTPDIDVNNLTVSTVLHSAEEVIESTSSFYTNSSVLEEYNCTDYNISNCNITNELYLTSSNGDSNYLFNIGIITGISVLVIIIVILIGVISFVLYRHLSWNRPQTLSDKFSNDESTGYIDDTAFRENSEEMYSLDNDSFLNSLEAMTIQNYWTDHVKHTKL